ncbi:MAG TPA: ribbon-helix-helix domain-containing protein [Alphaproteobacteria bacterium]|nr:ribbon-helix-helix domain-containing protein [Alphaproteobacteria bacterium]
MCVVDNNLGQSRSTLVNRNVTVNGHRTSMRLEPAMWEALEDICRRENRTIHDFCSLVDTQRTQSSLTAAMRVFILGYFRSGLTQQAASAEVSPRLGDAAVTKPWSP